MHVRKPRKRIAFVTILVGIPAFFAGPVLLPPHGDNASIGSLFTFVRVVTSMASSLALGFGIALLLFRWHELHAKKSGLMLWILLSLWPYQLLRAFVSPNATLVIIFDALFLLISLILAVIAARAVRSPRRPAAE